MTDYYIEELIEYNNWIDHNSVIINDNFLKIKKELKRNKNDIKWLLFVTTLYGIGFIALKIKYRNEINRLENRIEALER